MAIHVTVRVGLELEPTICDGRIGYRVFRPGQEAEIGYILHDRLTGLWLCGLPGGFSAGAPIYRNDSEALDALQRMMGPASNIPPLYARMTLAQLEAEEEAINRDYPAFAPQSSKELADMLLSLIDARKQMLRRDRAEKATACR